MNDKRYISGTCLTQTPKEEDISSIEKELGGDISDELFIALKKLTRSELDELYRLIREAKNP